MSKLGNSLNALTDELRRHRQRSLDWNSSDSSSDAHDDYEHHDDCHDDKHDRGCNNDDGGDY